MNAPETTDVYGYFTNVLGRPPRIQSLRNLPVDSGCGVDCVKAIDAAKALIDHVDMAYGASENRSKVKIRAIVESVVNVYWLG